ncbi:MAG: OmpA family protein [Sulfuricurvum sp.]|nr:OmpA family protein [Sulfuricurvum sp.]MDD5387139.1 OmpA family protein [Sulfuricurvum sp.]
MKQMTRSVVCALVLGIGLNGYAQSEQTTVSYFNGKENKTMNVQATQFAPAHPAACAEKKPAPIVEAPKPVVAIIPKAEGDADKDGVVDTLDKCPNTPHGYKVDPTGCPVSVTLHINFAFNSSVIPPSNYGDVTKLTRVMNENPPARAIIVGHTDYTGTDEYNQKLSERRSKALADKLIANGIDPKRISASGKGEKEPIATNATSAGRAQNRRIEVELQ